MRRAVAEKIAAFAQAGGRVFALNRWPSDSMNAGRDDPQITRLVETWRKHGAKLLPAQALGAEVARCVDRDVVVEGRGPCPLRYQHVRRDSREVYWVANDARQAGAWQVSFRAVGQPSLWQPEDGSIRPLHAFVRRGERTRCEVELDGWQGCFVVFDATDVPDNGGVLISSTNLHRPQLDRTADGGAMVSGLLSAGQTVANVEVKLIDDTGERLAKVSARVSPVPKPIALTGPWQFLAVADQLDTAWRTDVKESILSMPVMRAKWELPGEDADSWHLPEYDDSHWRQIKVFDKFHTKEGADRYRSRWQARFISHYEYLSPRTTVGGKGLRCRKTLDLPGGASGWLAVVCPSGFALLIDDQKFEGSGGKQAQRFDIAPLRGDRHAISIHADDAAALLLEGRLRTPDGRSALVRTDATWEARVEGCDWRAAWEYVAPPEKPFGDPVYPENIPRPRAVWYRQPLPPGTAAIMTPSIEGRWQAWIDGEAIEFVEGTADVPIAKHQGMLAVRAELDQGEHALIEPIRVHCRPVDRKLGSWTEENLSWYSGRAVYSTIFRLDAKQKQDDVRLELDLGKVCWCAEVWLNGQLLGTRIWPPYKLDITEKAKLGENRIDIVVANLLANRMHWDVFDDAKAEIWKRNWHAGNIMRDAWCLESGLIGPVSVQPLREVSIPLHKK
jgi:hypothetical protein